MEKNISYLKARELLIEKTRTVEKETISISDCYGRVLADDLKAVTNVPHFDRSPYDGYALNSSDTLLASKENPVTLSITEEIAAGSTPRYRVESGTAAKILTGAPVPDGADCVIMFEKTSFTKDTVTVFSPLKKGENIVKAGEDIKAGDVIAKKGTIIDPGIAGSAASQGIININVYKKPIVGIISTGTELIPFGEKLSAGKIYNSNLYTFTAALQKDGCMPEYIGSAKDNTDDIAALIQKGIDNCHMVIITGGVSVGDYDLTPDAMEKCGVEVFASGVDMKPGMACAYGEKSGKLICGLSGNPASSLTNYCAVVQSAVKKLQGLDEYIPEEFTVTLKNSFMKKSKSTRFLRGRIIIENGEAMLDFPQEQGNVVLTSMVGCNCMAVIPSGSGAVEKGTKLKAFMI